MNVGDALNVIDLRLWCLGLDAYVVALFPFLVRAALHCMRCHKDNIHEWEVI